MNKIIKNHGLCLGAILLGLTACQDDWDDHYSQVADAPNGTASLYEVMKENKDLAPFVRVLENTKLFYNCKQTDITYAQLLDGDQFFTVWAPIITEEEATKYINQAQTVEGDSLVELQFIHNHIARYAQSFNGTEKEIRFLNGKKLTMKSDSLETSAVLSSNIAARNGVLHTLEKPVPYFYSIYEAIVGKEEYKHFGDFIRSYQLMWLDESSSTFLTYKDGKAVYSDSVFYTSNEWLGYFDYIQREDSNFWMIAPTQELWDSAYAEAEKYFNYSYIEKEDSVHKRWAHYAVMQDMFYNMNPGNHQSINDSIQSTCYWDRNSSSSRNHRYFNPFKKDSLFNQDWVKVEQCCNGKIFTVNSWLFNKYRTYFLPIKKECETTYDTDETLTKVNYGSITSDSINASYAIVSYKNKKVDKYYVEYELRSVLSGTYDVCVVFLPRSVEVGKANGKKAKFVAELSYAGLDGTVYTVKSDTKYRKDTTENAYYVKDNTKGDFLFECNENAKTASTRAFVNNPEKVDTIKLCTFQFPTCEFSKQTYKNRIKLTNAMVKNSEASKYGPEWYIDKILLIPHKEEEAN